MCVTCGCSDTDGVMITDLSKDEKRVMTQAEHDHAHALGTPHDHSHEHAHGAMAYRPLRAPVLQEGLHSSHTHGHHHDHAHQHETHHEHLDNAEVVALHARTHGTTVALEQDILSKNQHLAEYNRDWFAERGFWRSTW